MSMFFPRQKRSYYQVWKSFLLAKMLQVIDGDEEEELDDPLSHPRNETQNSVNDQALPPSIHEATEVSFDSSSTRNNELTKSNSRWDHIEDVDQFFCLVYDYHRGSGLLCITLRHCFALFQFVLVVCLSTFLLQCVDYDVLFNNKNVTSEGKPIYGKRHIGVCFGCIISKSTFILGRNNSPVH